MLIAIVIILSGLFATYINRRELLLAWSSRRWPTVPGYVTGKRILEGVAGGASIAGTRSSTGRRWKELEIIYTYTVDDTEDSSSQIDFSGFGLLGDTQYYEDRELVTVFYSPIAPAIALLRPGIQLSMLFGPIITLVGLCAALYLL